MIEESGSCAHSSAALNRIPEPNTMAEPFHKFPHTPHLLWLGDGAPREDKVLTPGEAAAFLAGELIIEEKVDGANMGLSLGPDGRVRAQSRGNYLAPGRCHAQWNPLWPWLAERRGQLEARAKVASAGFKQQIEEHWTRRGVTPNQRLEVAA